VTLRQKLHDPLSATTVLAFSLCVFEKKLFVVERWYAQFSLNTNLQANSTYINLKFPPNDPTRGAILGAPCGKEW